ncbi:MAG: four helix bundle protein [Ignavibacteria bacterium]|nr:four helix bundle protein [Ignavibacteria bacterium]
MDGEDGIIAKHGGYENLLSFQIAELVFDVTVHFCNRYISRRSRTHDQMVQAARSGVQNIVEGSKVSCTSKKMEMKLTGVARASLEELRRDYRDYLRQRGLEEWPPYHAVLMRFKSQRYYCLEDVRRFVQEERGRTRGNGKDKDKHGPSLTDMDAQGRMATIESGTKVGSDQKPSMPFYARPCGFMPTSGIVANVTLSLLNLCSFLLARQLAAQAAAFEREGGFTERLYRTRQNWKKQH